MVTPSGRTHLIASLMLSIMIIYRWEFSIESIFFGILGGLLPDSDIKQSKISFIFPLYIWFKPHRKNIMHSLLGAIVWSVPFLFLSFHYAITFFISYISHILLDLCTKTGIPLFYPNKKMISIAKFKSGKKSEWILLFLFYMILIIIMNL